MNKKRFLDLCTRAAGQASEREVEGWFEVIANHYREPHRRYHTPEHVQHCLRQFDMVNSLLVQPDAVEFAVWYHDAVYDSAGTDNELRSAQLFKAHVSRRMQCSLVDAVVDLIMVTVHSRQEPRTSDQRFMVDIDLSSFGLPWPKFLADSIAVRDEFPLLRDDEFYPSQARFLRTLLARPSFCLTPFFRERYEQQARDNISRYLEQLQSEGKL